MVLSEHLSNVPENFSCLHFFPGWHDFLTNAPGLYHFHLYISQFYEKQTYIYDVANEHIKGYAEW